MKGVLPRLKVATGWPSASRARTRCSPRPRLPPLTMTRVFSDMVRPGARLLHALIGERTLRDRHDRGDLEGIQSALAELAHPLADLVSGLGPGELHRHHDDLSNDGARPALHEHVLDVGHAEEDVLHLLGKDLLAADVDELGLPAEDAHVVAAHL